MRINSCKHSHLQNYRNINNFKDKFKKYVQYNNIAEHLLANGGRNVNQLILVHLQYCQLSQIAYNSKHYLELLVTIIITLRMLKKYNTVDS